MLKLRFREIKMEKSEFSRRDFLVRVSAGAALSFVPLSLMDGAWATENPRPDGKEVSPAEALVLLKDGNKRVVKGRAIRKNLSPAGKAWTDGQWPFAAVLGCADSRVHPDEVFDIAPANLFVVRNAGNVIDDDVLGSLEYAVEHLSVGLIVVMGHSNCGAVKATEGIVKNGGKAGGHIDAIVEKIRPAITPLPASHTLADAVKANAIQSAKLALSESDLLAEAIKKNELKIVSSVFDLKTKAVTFN
jgi:carbonic anhydrase